MTAKHPDIKINLVGVDGNAYSIMGVVTKALKRAGFHEDAAEYVRRVTHEAQTYEEGISMAFEYVEHEEMDDEDEGSTCIDCGADLDTDDDYCDECDDDFDADEDPDYR